MQLGWKHDGDLRCGVGVPTPVGACPSRKRGRRSLGRGGLLDPDYFALGVEVHDVADGLALLLDGVENDVAPVGGALIADAVDLAVLMTALLHAGHELVLGGVAHAWTKAGVRGV